MKSPSHFLARRGLLLFSSLFLTLFSYSQTFTLISSDIDIASNGFVDDDGCAGFKDAQCNFVNATLQGGVYGNQFANDCGYRRVENQPFQCYTSVDANHFYALNGAGTNTVSIDWLNFESVWHDIEMGVLYVAFNNSIASMNLILDVAGVSPGTKIKVYYSYDIFSGAVGAAEMGELEMASVTPTLNLLNKDLILQGGFNLNVNAGPTAGMIRRAALAGFFNVTVGQPIPVSIATIQDASIFAPGIDHKHIQNLDYWKDFATAEFGGNLTLSLSPLPIPVTPVPPAFSVFSVDIGSASELSDPMANGTEYFDPGDAYRFYGPALPLGGADGVIDDASFFTVDPFPSAPDPAVPSITEAPVASGFPLGLVQSSYFDMDGVDQLDFVVQPNGLPQIANPSGCLLPVKHLFVSLDDDKPQNYLSTPPLPGAPANSRSFSLNREYGSTALQDEMYERSYSASPFFPLTTFGIATEQAIHPNLGPNPILGANLEDDDIDALDLASVQSGCNIVYFSADHEATAIDVTGLPLDPGIIYRNVPGGIAPAVFPIDLGIPPGTDINAFEFAVILDPLNPFGAGTLALLFSADYDDPETIGVDESGGLEPDLIYQSFLDGSFSVLDSIHYDDNVDAISLLNQSLFAIPGATTCNPYNYTDPPTGLSASVSATNVSFSWDPYPFSTVCQISGNKISNPNDVTILVQSSPGNTPPSTKTLSINQLQPSTAYRVKVRCGCQFQGVQQASPFTAYINFTTPGPLPPPGFTGSDVFAGSNSLSVFPNPGSDFITVSFTGYSEEAIVRLRDISGRELTMQRIGKSGLIGSIQLNISDFSPGVYILEISEGDLTKTERLVVQ